ncbi:MAG: flippase [Chitinophagales bacterium]
MIRRLKKKFDKKLKDKDFSEIFKKGATGFFISLIGRPLGLIQVAIITNFFGADANGVFRVCFSIFSLVVIFGRFGVDMAMSRFVAQYRKQGRYDLVNEVFQKSMRIVVPLAAFLSVAVYFLAPVIAHYIYHDKPYTVPIRIFSIGIFFSTISGVLEEGLRGLKKIKEYSWINNVSTQGIVSVLLLVCLLFTRDPMWVSILYVIALFITWIFGVYYWFKFVPYQRITTQQIETKEILHVSLPMLSAKYLTTLYTWVDTLILAAFVIDTDVSTYNVASRVTAFATLPLIAINNISSSKFAEAYGEGDTKYLKKTVRISSRLIFWTCMPIMLAFLLVPKLFLFIFGQEVLTERAILAFHIINIGQIVNFMTGPVTVFLNMTGRQKVSQLYSAITMVVSIALCFLLIPEFGLLGAAIATAASRTVLNLGCALHVYFTTGISTFYNPVEDFKNFRERRRKRSARKDQLQEGGENA